VETLQVVLFVHHLSKYLRGNVLHEFAIQALRCAKLCSILNSGPLLLPEQAARN